MPWTATPCQRLESIESIKLSFSTHRSLCLSTIRGHAILLYQSWLGELVLKVSEADQARNQIMGLDSEEKRVICHDVQNTNQAMAYHSISTLSISCSKSSLPSLTTVRKTQRPSPF